MAMRIDRRHFIKASGLALPALSGSSVFAATAKKKIGVALVGLGNYSTTVLAPALQLTKHCELRGIVTGSPQKIPVWQKKYGVPDKNVYSYENMHKLADNASIDVVYIVVPTFLHKKYAVIAANTGKHVWCEKPMAMTPAECEAIIGACQKNGVKLSIGYRLQHEPNTRQVIKYAKEKPYGAIKKVIAEAGYGGKGEPPGNWRMDQSKGGGALYDMGVYPINAARYATGMVPVAVTAKHLREHPKVFVHCDEATEFTLEFKEGVIAHCRTSVVQNYNQLRVDCENGWYQLQPMQNYTGVKGETSDGKKWPPSTANQQATQMDDDALAILQKTAVAVPGSEGLWDIRIVQAILRSASLGKRIEI